MSTNSVQIEVTADLIREEGVKVALIRKVSTRTPAGGVIKGEQTTLPEVKRFFSGTTSDQRVLTNDSGTVVEGSYVLIGMPSDDIKAGDEFELFGNRYRVFKIHGDKRFQIKAWAENA